MLQCAGLNSVLSWAKRLDANCLAAIPVRLAAVHISPCTPPGMPRLFVLQALFIYRCKIRERETIIGC